MRSCSRVQSSEIRSTGSSPSSRRPVWIACSKRLSAIWRKTVATVSSIRPTSRSSRARGSSSRSISRSKVSASPKTEAVSARVSGVLAFSRPRSCASDAVQAVAELVREREHAAPLAGVVHQHVRVHVRDRRGAEGAEHLARPHRRVDPVALEEAADDLAGLRREAVERVQHELARVVPRDRAADLLERREAVVVAQLRQAEQPRLQRVEALRDVVAGDDRVDEALRRLVGDLVREVARGDPAR